MLRSIFYVLFFTPHRAIFLYRVGAWFYRKNMRTISYMIKHLSITLNGCDISPAAKIGKNPTLCHTLGIVIGEGAIIGDNVRLFQNITLGTKDGFDPSYPVIGNNVTLFSGATVAGKVFVGDNSIVGANSLVLKDVPPHSVAVGNPAKIKIKTLDKQQAN